MALPRRGLKAVIVIAILMRFATHFGYTSNFLDLNRLYPNYSKGSSGLYCGGAW